MYALRERRQHVTQEDFELSVAKVSFPRPLPVAELLADPLRLPRNKVLRKAGDANTSSNKLFN